MLKLIKKIELEWKITVLFLIISASIIFIMHSMYISRLKDVVDQSVNPGLEPWLSERLKETPNEEKTELINIIKRERQWNTLLPIIIREQQTSVLTVSALLFLSGIILAYIVSRSITGPIKNIASAAEEIGMGNFRKIKIKNGGALGKLEKSMNRMQDQLKELREKAAAAGMEAAWREIARVMAHEIKNPLTPMRLTLDRLNEKLLLEGEISAKDVERASDRITRQVETLESLVNSFRSFAREPEVRSRNLDAVKAIEENTASFKHALTAEVRGEGTIKADPLLFNQIMINLLKNSMEAGASKIMISVFFNQDKVSIILDDNGPGIAKDIINRIWVPYFTEKKTGSGLGLPVVKRLIEGMKGEIETRGTGKDFKFEITMPAA
ncbi:MAG: sensor histidine kinase [Fibrobacterota bacterium]